MSVDYGRHGAVGYFFGVLKWTRKYLVSMDRKTRKLMRQNTHSASLERLYLPRGEGGRGMTMIEFEWEREAVASTLYLARCTDPQVRGTMAMQNFLMEVGRYSYLQKAQEVLNGYDLGYSLTENDTDDLPVPKLVHQQLKEAQLQMLRDRLSRKVLHGVFMNTLAPDCDQTATHAWLSDGRLRPTTEGQIIKEHHDRVFYQLVCAVAGTLGLTIPKVLRAPRGKITPGVTGTFAKRLIIDQTLLTDREISDRRPDLVVCLRNQRRVIIFELAYAWDPTVTEWKNQKRRELAAGLSHQWPGYRIEVIPVVVGRPWPRKQLQKAPEEIANLQ